MQDFYLICPWYSIRYESTQILSETLKLLQDHSDPIDRYRPIGKRLILVPSKFRIVTTIEGCVLAGAVVLCASIHLKQRRRH